ncbi:MAG: DUF1501 domain-containing protein [Polyangiaceae bacterium]|nr:DUF1501 domain-containing protein [Polyangiaceae bacterium]
MERRDFLKLCSMTGLTVVAGSALSGSEAEAAEYSGTFFVNIAQMGCWDVTNICDPKGAPSAEAAAGNAPTDTMNRYLTSAIPVASNGVSWAPLSQSADLANNAAAQAQALVFETFMEANAERMLVINGIDYQTNSHDVGARLSVTGNAAENTAAFGAVAAAALLPNAPMGFVGFGGYTGTGGLTAVTRLGNIDVIKRLAYPYRRDPNDPEALYYNDAQAEMIAKAREARFNSKMGQQRLPKLRGAMNTLYLSRLGQNELKRLVDYLPEGDALLDGIAGAVQLAAAAYKAGLCVAVSISSNAGWDHHGTVDTNIANSLGRLFDPDQGVPRALQVLEDVEIADKTLLSLTSDFGRTPGYNDGNGKDHWPITSNIFMGAVNGRPIKSGVKGGTDDRHQALGVNPDTGVLDESSSLTIKAGHIQNALRRLAGILDSEAASKQPTTESPAELENLIELT